MKKYISVFLILLGIIFLLIPITNDLIIKYNINNRKIVIDEITPEKIQENMTVEAEYDYYSIKDVEIVSVISGAVEFEDESIIGQIVINDLNVDLPILKGVTNSNLLVGAATMVPDIEMGKGNFSLSGHKMKNKNLLFGSLMDIKTDTIVKITDKRTIYEYKIYATDVVPDTAFYMLDEERAEERGKPIISLMTCYYSSKTGKRFFALGELIDEYPYREEDLYDVLIE